MQTRRVPGYSRIYVVVVASRSNSGVWQTLIVVVTVVVVAAAAPHLNILKQCPN